MIKRVHNVHYWTKDTAAAVAFYRDVLGLTFRFQAGEDWAEFDAGGDTVALHGGQHEPPQGGATVVFEVDDLDAAMAMLRGRGVSFDERIADVPGFGRFASFSDPDGNVLQLFQPARQG